jgi:hypothetical protein
VSQVSMSQLYACTPAEAVLSPVVGAESRLPVLIRTAFSHVDRRRARRARTVSLRVVPDALDSCTQAACRPCISGTILCYQTGIRGNGKGKIAKSRPPQLDSASVSSGGR